MSIDLLRPLLPAGVAVAETTGDAGEDGLFPVERERIVRAVAKRRAEFSTVRALARQAMADLGVPPAPILPGDRGAPGWPDGVLGSMTHCAGYRAAALARTATVAGLGIDAEPHEPLPDGVADTVIRPEEQVRLAELAAAEPDVHWQKVLFSMKESVYKVWFPITGRWLDFSEASIRISATDRTFDARLLVPPPVLAGREIFSFEGRFAVGAGLIITAIVLPHN